MKPLHELGAAEAVALLSRRDISAEQLISALLDRIGSEEPRVQAFEHLDPQRALAQARAADAQRRAPLYGLPVGIKDIIDTADLPTEWGTPIHRGRRPALDASCVQRLRAAGAVILGKTVTTELAYFSPGKTRNPHDPARTPGGSSSGSAAAVAARTLPAALGTQTAGSVIRPASFCGVLGFKPTHGALPLGGVMPFAPSLDTLGLFARELEDLPLLFGVLAGAPLRIEARHRPARIGLLQIGVWAQLDAAMARLLDETGRALRATTVPLPAEWTGLLEVQRTIMAAEAARSFAADRVHESELSEPLRALLAEGDAAGADRVQAAREAARRARAILPAIFAQHDALLAPSALGEAPPRETGTGDPSLNRAFTLLGVPCLSLPLGKGPSGLPLGLQLVGPPGREADLIAIASAVLTSAPRA